jgi:hypothetical protein
MAHSEMPAAMATSSLVLWVDVRVRCRSRPQARPPAALPRLIAARM